MADGATFNIPKLGEVKKSYVYAGGAAIGGYVAWRWWQAGQAAPQDEAPPPESTGTIGAEIGSGAGGYYPTPPIGGDTDVTQGGAITTDAQWSARALEWLVNAGYDTALASVALGKYLRSEALTGAEQNMIRIALAFVGNPPSGAKPLVPGGDAPNPSAIGTPRNLRSAGAPTTSAVPMQWDAVTGAAKYRVFRDGTTIGDTTSTSMTATGLASSHSYRFDVRALNSSGAIGPMSNSYTARTATLSGGVAKPPPATSSGGIPPYRTVIARPGDSISKIAARYGKSWQTVWQFNLKYRPASTVKTLQARGPNTIFAGTRIWVPK